MKTKILADFEICLSEPLMLVMVILPGIYLFKVNNGNTKTMQNLFKVNNEDTRTMSLANRTLKIRQMPLIDFNVIVIYRLAYSQIIFN